MYEDIKRQNQNSFKAYRMDILLTYFIEELNFINFWVLNYLSRQRAVSRMWCGGTTAQHFEHQWRLCRVAFEISPLKPQGTSLKHLERWFYPTSHLARIQLSAAMQSSEKLTSLHI